MKLVIGFITYGDSTAKYLPYFLPSVFNSSFKDFKVLVIDNSEEKENRNKQYIRDNFKNINFEWAGKNLGFAKAYNKMIQKAQNLGAKYFLMLNPDMIVEPQMIERLISKIEKDSRLAVVTPKILRMKFDEVPEKTDLIDSCGLSINREHRFADLYQGKKGENIIEPQEVFGFTGAAALCRMNALRDVKFKDEYFDELMFMYKEDCDLSYRLRLAGWRVFFEPEAICYHDRTASPLGRNNIEVALNRFKKSKQVKKWSFLNQLIIINKFAPLHSFNVRMKTYNYQAKSLLFALVFEKYLIKELFYYFKIKDQVKEKRDNLKIKVDIKEITKFMQ